MKGIKQIKRLILIPNKALQSKRQNIKLKHLICVILLLLALDTNAQSHLYLETNFLAGFQNKKELNQRKISNAHYLGLQIGTTWQIPIRKRLFFETGVFGKFIKSKSETELANYSSKVVSLQIPVLFGIELNKWQHSGGLTFENNRDFEDMNINSPFNLRVYASLKTSLQIKPRYKLSLSGNFNISKIPDSYLISNPANYISLGVIYKLI